MRENDIATLTENQREAYEERAATCEIIQADFAETWAQIGYERWKAATAQQDMFRNSNSPTPGGGGE